MSHEAIQSFFALEFLGNTVQTYAIARGIFFAVIIGLWILKTVVVKRLRRLAERTATDIDDFLIGLPRHVGPVTYFVLALYLATRSLVLPDNLERVIHILFVVILTFKIIQTAQEIAAFLLRKWAARAEPDDPTSAVVVTNMIKVLRVALWATGVIFVLDNLGIHVTSIVAGLGIGGVAVALAAQSLLGDAFSSFAIFVDKPFKVGDFIIVGDLLGTVEHVGFKTTRVRSLGGEQLIFSNSDLTSSRIRNYKRMKTRRIVFTVGVTYQTTLEQVKAIPGIIEEIIKSHELAKFDRAHFKSFGDFALIFEAVYNVLAPEYNKYMDVQQSINEEIMEAFQKRGIEFAYPTQQLFVTQVTPPT